MLLLLHLGVSLSPIGASWLMVFRAWQRGGVAASSPGLELVIALLPILLALIACAFGAWKIRRRLRAGGDSFGPLIYSTGFSASGLIPVILAAAAWLVSVLVFKSELLALLAPLVFGVTWILVEILVWVHLKR